MLFLYIRIFTIIKNHQEQRSLHGSVRNFTKNSVTKSMSNTSQTRDHASGSNTKEMIISLKWCTECSRTGNSTPKTATAVINKNGDFGNSSIKSHSSNTSGGSGPCGHVNLNGRRSVTTASTKYHFQSNVNACNHTKALITTLLILGTYIICWVRFFYLLHII